MEFFHRHFLPKRPVLVINGDRPLELYCILHHIATKLLNLRLLHTNCSEMLGKIKRTLRKRPLLKIFVLVHNLDGWGIANAVTQNTLCELAALPNLNLLASLHCLDSVEVWRTQQLDWWYTHSYWQAIHQVPWVDGVVRVEPDAIEAYNFGDPALAVLHGVFRSLAFFGQSVFMQLVNLQLLFQRKHQARYYGIRFKTLWGDCRECGLCLSPFELKVWLDLFSQHNMVRRKRNQAGWVYIIPLSLYQLMQFYQGFTFYRSVLEVRPPSSLCSSSSHRAARSRRTQQTQDDGTTDSIISPEAQYPLADGTEHTHTEHAPGSFGVTRTGVVRILPLQTPHV
ncbi:origin recognition complex subunit 2 [Anopheles sinensis]|uniref:Origin recognition complex subunit 2 n=1 Tax=Anopheles sinensis TaxID=74873 RepID=A0A084WF62_ANOSI|nr:origin recognition complex subunit 2 [Anopheles sinensis]